MKDKENNEKVVETMMGKNFIFVEMKKYDFILWAQTYGELVNMAKSVDKEKNKTPEIISAANAAANEYTTLRSQFASDFAVVAKMKAETKLMEVARKISDDMCVRLLFPFAGTSQEEDTNSLVSMKEFEDLRRSKVDLFIDSYKESQNMITEGENHQASKDLQSILKHYDKDDIELMQNPEKHPDRKAEICDFAIDFNKRTTALPEERAAGIIRLVDRQVLRETAR